MTVPTDATEGTTAHRRPRAPISGRVDDACRSTSGSRPNAAGDISLTTDIPQLKGASDATFPFSLTLNNDTAEDLPFSVVATGPAGWTVTAQVGSPGAGRERRGQGRQHARR